MKVIRARILGFCMGVSRAVELAKAAAAKNRRVYTIGPLIHNPQALADLAQRGVEILEPPPDPQSDLPVDLTGAVVIIRAHGITPLLEAELRRRGAELVDATCPRVKASQKKARVLSEAGCTVFLAGEKRHAEISGIVGYAPGCVVIGSREEAESAAQNAVGQSEGSLQAALLAQTTLSPEEYQEIAEGIAKYIPRINVLDTICGATLERQDSLRELCTMPEVEAVIIAGGRSSANTRRLKMIARNSGKPAWLVETPADFPPELSGYSTLGLSAGASTPEATVAAIETALRLLS
jgi:4-hydroxy-3-methylbut-2-enyl diphosphate reductase